MVNRKRPIVINFRVDEKEKKIIDKKIKDANIGKENYLRETVIKGNIFIQDLKHYSILAKSVDAVGRNINQIARYVNQNHMVSAHLLKEVEMLMEKIWQLLK